MLLCTWRLTMWRLDGFAQVEQLHACCPRLAPSVMPHGYDSQDLFGVAQMLGEFQRCVGPLVQHIVPIWYAYDGPCWAPAGKGAVNALSSFVEEASSSARSCCVCDCVGQPSTSDSIGEEEEDVSKLLSFTVFAGISFTDKLIQLKRAGVSS